MRPIGSKREREPSYPDEDIGPSRAIEKRRGEEIAAEQLEAHELGPVPCDSLCRCDDDWTDDWWYDYVLEVGVDNRPMTVKLVEAI